MSAACMLGQTLDAYILQDHNLGLTPGYYTNEIKGLFQCNVDTVLRFVSSLHLDPNKY